MKQPQGNALGRYRGVVAVSVLLFLAVVSPSTVRADPIAITGGSYTTSNPFRNVPKFVSFTADLQGTDFRLLGHESDGPGVQVRTNCAIPCMPGSTLSLSSTHALGSDSPTSLLELNGVQHFGFNTSNSWPQFDTGTVTIPIDPDAEFTLSTTFTMKGAFSFEEYDPQSQVLTGFTFASEIYGSGLADISFFVSRTTGQYEISRVRYTFQSKPVPEPASLILLGMGIAGLATKRVRRRQAKKLQMEFEPVTTIFFKSEDLTRQSRGD